MNLSAFNSPALEYLKVKFGHAGQVDMGISSFFSTRFCKRTESHNILPNGTYFGGHLSMRHCHGITEPSELEGTHQDRVQPLSGFYRP